MKRNSPRVIAHAQHTDPNGRHEALLFPWMHGRYAKGLRQDVSANESEDRKWAWIGVGIVAVSAVSALSLYGWLISLL
jgi:hypothetical protein